MNRHIHTISAVKPRRAQDDSIDIIGLKTFTVSVLTAVNNLLAAKAEAEA